MTDAGVDARFEGRLGAFRLDASLQTTAAGITTITGPSGSGKTTLLRCVAGLERLPGRLSVGGEVWQDVRIFKPAHQRAVGMVFQEASLFAHLSVRDNLLYGAKRAPKPHAIGLDETIDLLGLGPVMARGPQRLSAGERQRVAIGRALLSQPRLLLMDEPVANLDPSSRAEVLSYLEQLHAALMIPVIYVTHDEAEARRLSDRRLVMRGGQIAPQTPEDPEALEVLRREVDAMSREALKILAMETLKSRLKSSGNFTDII